ncbi:type III secretion system protein SctK [Cupriavidus sp. SIMBA_020]|uniref:type III secretion system protein SctK n=1 Tax=Cupriavidus sp. SIMBA_020 TaxID=3085766 RepID=UPI003978BA68
MSLPAAALPTALAPASPALPDAALARAVAALLQQPLAQLHPSWLPADWPLAWRRPARFGDAAADVLAALLGLAADAVARDTLVRALTGEGDVRADVLPRIVLMDRPALRLLALWVGLAVHKPGFASERRIVPAPLANIESIAGSLIGQLPRAMRRVARRIDAQAVAFLLKRVPDLSELPMNLAPLRARPSGAGRVMAERGYRLLCGLMAGYGAPLRQALMRKFPRRLAALPPVALTRAQAAQLRELLLLNLIPERFPAWHWLF